VLRWRDQPDGASLHFADTLGGHNLSGPGIGEIAQSWNDQRADRLRMTGHRIPAIALLSDEAVTGYPWR